MALDHSRLGLENKFLENKSGRIFCFRQVYFTKSCQQVWGRVNQPFILFIHHIWGETVLFIIQTSDLQYCTIFQDKLHSVNIQEDQPWTFRENVKTISKITYTASRFSLLTSAKFAVNINRVTLQHNKEFIIFIFLFNGFLTMYNLEKRLIGEAFWALLHAMFMNDWKQTAHGLKLQESLLTINKRNIIRWSIYRDNNFLHDDRY